MTKWFRLSNGTSYSWKSKLSGKSYSFENSDQCVAVDNVDDQIRMLGMPDRLVEVDQRGGAIVQAVGQPVPMAFSRHGMVQPRSYAKITRSSPAVPDSSQEVPAPRKIVSSKKAAVSSKKAAESSAPEAPQKAPVKAIQDAPVLAAVASTAQEADDASESRGQTPSDASQGSAPKKRTMRSSKKSGRTGD